MTRYAADEAALRALAAELAPRLRTGDTVLLSGPLGAGKTTFARGLLEALGHLGSVRSPTYNLVQTFETQPPVMHADLYRVKSHQGLGLEDYLDTHLCLIEWPDRAEGLRQADECWRVDIQFAELGRNVTVTEPE